MKIGSLASHKKRAEANAVKWFNKFICLRDLERLPTGEIKGYCISCGKEWEAILYSDKSIMNGKEWHAGHYWKSDRHESVRFHEWNVSGQHGHCNVYKHGDEANYEGNLRIKIGDDNFLILRFLKNQIKKNSIIDYENISKEYKEKAKIEAKRLGIKHY